MTTSHAVPLPEELFESGQREMWNDANVPLAQRGIRLSWLRELVESLTWHANEPRRRALEAAERAHYQQQASIRFDNVPWPEPVHVPEQIAFTTRRFVSEHIKAWTAPVKGPLYAIAPAHAKGAPQVFISHAWDSYLFIEGHKFGVLDAVGPGIAGVQAEFVWIDIACYNQHVQTAEMRVAPDMWDVINSIGKIAFPITPVTLFDRIWCIWELLCAAQLSDAGFCFCAAPGFRTDKRIMVNDFVNEFTSLADAKATERADREMILDQVVANFGSIAAADDYVRDLMRRGLSNPWFGLYSSSNEPTSM